MKEVIKVENLKKTFGKSTAVNNISFSVKKEEILSFLGPNGAGKTTTIAIFLRPFVPSLLTTRCQWMKSTGLLVWTLFMLFYRLSSSATCSKKPAQKVSSWNCKINFNKKNARRLRTAGLVRRWTYCVCVPAMQRRSFSCMIRARIRRFLRVCLSQRCRTSFASRPTLIDLTFFDILSFPFCRIWNVPSSVALHCLLHAANPPF